MRLRLKELRKHHGLMQKDLAEYLEVKQQTYSRYENGEARPSLEVMEKLSAYYEGTSANKLAETLIRQFVVEYEKKHEEISPTRRA